MRTPLLVSILVVTALVPLVPFAQATGFTVTAANLSWTPQNLQIAPGDTITFVNSTAGTPHTWVRDDGADSCNLPCTRTFATAATIPYRCGIHSSMRGTIQVGAGMSVAITSPTSGSTVSGLVIVTGTASHGSQNVTSVTVRFDNGASVPATLSGPRMNVTWSATINSTLVSNAPHNLVARATSANSASEANISVIANNPDVIDLNMTLVSAPQGSTGTSMQISFTMRNDGNVESGPVRVRGEYFYQNAWHLIGEVNAVSVSPGQNRFGTLTWDPDGILLGKFTFRMTADPAGSIPDIDRSNNARSGSAGWFTSLVNGVDLADPL